MTFRLRRRLNRHRSLIVVAVDELANRAEIVHEETDLRECLAWTLDRMGPRDTLDAKVTLS
jgi:hypothetical protein